MVKIFQRTKNQNRADEMNFFSFFHSSPDLLFVFTTDSKIIEANRTAAEKLNYKIEELIGKSVFELHPEESRSDCEKYLNEVLDGKRSYCPLPLITKSGIPLPVETTLSRGKWNGRDVIYSICKDISLRVQAEETARKIEERFTILFNNINDAVFLHGFTDDGLPGKFIEANLIACQRLGYSRDELIKMTPKDIDAPEGWALVPDIMERLKTEKHVVWEGLHVSKNGNKIPVEINNHLFELEGEPVILATVRDITYRKAVEMKLRKSEEKYRKIFENVQDIFYQADTSGKILEISPSIERYSGYRPDELIGMKVEDVYLNPADRGVLLKILTEKGEIQDYVILLKTKEKKKVYVSANVHLLFGPDGKPSGVEGSLRDVSERIVAEERLKDSEQLLRKQNEEYLILNEQLKIAKEKAEESDRLKSAFLANMSHEIRTPMNGIMGFSQMLADSTLKDKEREAYSRIVNSSCVQLLHIVNDIIDISKIEAGQMEFAETEFNLKDLIDEVYSFFLPSAREKQIDLILDPLPADLAGIIISDSTKIRQIIDNLVSNALKFTNSGSVVIRCEIDNKYLQFQIKDTGIGIHKDMQNVIFERFIQVETSYTKKYGGTGLGLAISKAYIGKMGGSIWVESEPGIGSTFFFRLPYKPLHGREKKEEPVVITTKIKGDLTILIVEDEEINWLYLNEILKKKARLLHASNGSQALDYIMKNPEIDLVLLDIKLPDINGFEVAGKIKEIRPEIPVIAQTAYALAGDSEKAIEAGCTDYLTKPIKKDDLLKKISFFTEK